MVGSRRGGCLRVARFFAAGQETMKTNNGLCGARGAAQWIFAFALVGAAVAGAGCEGSDPAGAVEAGDDQNLVPAAATNHYDQAMVCDKIFKRHAAIRDADMKEGVVRWACGDVPGVTGKDLGQEYCEYKAVSAGKQVLKATDVKNGKVSCLFTSVYADTKGQYLSPETLAYGRTLATKLKEAKNLNVATLTESETDALSKISVMSVGFNTRGAATALVVDCARNVDGGSNGTTLTKEKKAAALLDEARQSACYLAGVRTPAKAASLKTACRAKDLSVAANWASAEKLGAKVAVPGEADYELQRDIAGCLRSKASGSVTWRNSDPMICARVTRAVTECGTQYVGIPDAVEGFTFTGWTNKALPSACRFAQIDGKEYKHLVICEASSSEVSNLAFKAQWKNDLTQFCRDRFAQDIVMQAPIRALQTAGNQSGAFCSMYNQGYTK